VEEKAGYVVFKEGNADGTYGPKVGAVRSLNIPHQSLTVYSNSPGNASLAYEKRVQEKTLKPALTREDRVIIDKATAYMRKEVFTEENMLYYLQMGEGFETVTHFTQKQWKTKLNQIFDHAEEHQNKALRHNFGGIPDLIL